MDEQIKDLLSVFEQDLAAIQKKLDAANQPGSLVTLDTIATLLTELERTIDSWNIKTDEFMQTHTFRPDKDEDRFETALYIDEKMMAIMIHAVAIDTRLRAMFKELLDRMP